MDEALLPQIERVKCQRVEGYVICLEWYLWSQRLGLVAWEVDWFRIQRWSFQCLMDRHQLCVVPVEEISSNAHDQN